MVRFLILALRTHTYPVRHIFGNKFLRHNFRIDSINWHWRVSSVWIALIFILQYCSIYVQVPKTRKRFSNNKTSKISLFIYSYICMTDDFIRHLFQSEPIITRFYIYIMHVAYSVYICKILLTLYPAMCRIGWPIRIWMCINLI